MNKKFAQFIKTLNNVMDGQRYRFYDASSEPKEISETSNYIEIKKNQKLPQGEVFRYNSPKLTK